MLTVLVSRDSTDAVPGQGVLALRCATTGAGFRLDIPVVAQRQFLKVHLFMLMVQFSDKVFDVVHSPFEWLDHRCHCNCRDLVLFVGRLPCCGVFASRCRVVEEVSLLIVLRFCLGQRETDDLKILSFFPVPRRRWVFRHAEWLVQQH